MSSAFCVIMYRSYTFLKTVKFFGPPCIYSVFEKAGPLLFLWNIYRFASNCVFMILLNMFSYLLIINNDVALGCTTLAHSALVHAGCIRTLVD